MTGLAINSCGDALRTGGLAGQATYEDHLGLFAGLIALGEILHKGKGTRMGLESVSGAGEQCRPIDCDVLIA